MAAILSRPQFVKAVSIHNKIQYKSKGFAMTIQTKDKIVNDPKNFGNAFNEYFSNVALNIGNEGPLTDDETIDDILCKYDDRVA